MLLGCFRTQQGLVVVHVETNRLRAWSICTWCESSNMSLFCILSRRDTSARSMSTTIAVPAIYTAIVIFTISVSTLLLAIMLSLQHGNLNLSRNMSSPLWLWLAKPTYCLFGVDKIIFLFSCFMPDMSCHWKVWVRDFYCPKMSL